MFLSVWPRIHVLKGKLLTSHISLTFPVQLMHCISAEVCYICHAGFSEFNFFKIYFHLPWTWQWLRCLGGPDWGEVGGMGECVH